MVPARTPRMRTNAAQTSPAAAAGTFELAGRTVARLGFGAMQLAGRRVMGPPADPEEARSVLRRAVELGVNHIDTSDYYGPHVTNQLIREALHPYPDDLVLVTKVGVRRDERGRWPVALEPAEIRGAIEDNIRHLGVDAVDVVNLRMGDPAGPVEGLIGEPLETLAQLVDDGLVRHVGLSCVTDAQLAEAQAVLPVACVQNHFNVNAQSDAALVDRCAREGIPYVPYFPGGGYKPLASEALDAVAARHGATTRQIALAWLLHRAPSILVIPGTSSVAHLEENVAAASIELTADDLATLD